MILRVAVFALMALGLSGFGMIAWLATRSPAAEPPAVVASISAIPQAAPPVAVKLLTVSRALRAGTLMKPDDLAPGDVASPPADALSDTPQVRAGLVGAMVRHSLELGAPIVPGDIVRPGDHGFLAAVLGSGMRAISVGVDAVTGSAGLIWPGDWVDLILTQELENTAIPQGRRVLGETVLPDLRVVAIDQQIAQGVNPQSTDNVAASKTITLEVTPRQSETVAVAARIGRLSVVVRSADQTAEPERRPAGPPVPTWASDVSPGLGTGPAQTGTTLRLFQGTSEGKEFKF